MTKLLAVCCIAMFASFAVQTSAQEQQQPLRLTQTIALPGVKGRLDHMGVDLEKKRLFVATVTNNTLEVVDLTGGKVINRLAGIKDAQDALFLGGDFNKLYVSSLDGHVRVFQGDTFRLVQDFKVEAGPNRLFYDPATNLIYFGYGGQMAGNNAPVRVGILQPKRGVGNDQLVGPSLSRRPAPVIWPRSRWRTTASFLFVIPSRTSSIKSTRRSANLSRADPREVAVPQTWRSTRSSTGYLSARGFRRS
jgi:hypothetical protein